MSASSPYEVQARPKTTLKIIGPGAVEMSTQLFDWTINLDDKLLDALKYGSCQTLRYHTDSTGNRVVLGSGKTGVVYQMIQIPVLQPNIHISQEDFKRVLLQLGVEDQQYPARFVAMKVTTALEPGFEQESFINEATILQECAKMYPSIFLEQYCYFYEPKENRGFLILELLSTLSQQIPVELSAYNNPMEAVYNFNVNSGFNLATVFNWAYQLTCTVERLHREGFVHRDIKVANIGINSMGVAKLLDYGFAIKSDISSDNFTSAGSPMCMPPSLWIKGVPKSWMAVFSLDKKKMISARPSSDAFALGLVFLQLLYPSFFVLLQTLSYLKIDTQWEILQQAVLLVQNLGSIDSFITNLYMELRPYDFVPDNHIWEDHVNRNFRRENRPMYNAFKKIVWGLLRITDGRNDVVIDWMGKNISVNKGTNPFIECKKPKNIQGAGYQHRYTLEKALEGFHY